MSLVLAESRLLPSGPCSELIVAVTQRQAEEMEAVVGLETRVKAAVQLVSLGGQHLHYALCQLQEGGEGAVEACGPYAMRVLEAFCVHASGAVPVYEHGEGVEGVGGDKGHGGEGGHPSGEGDGEEGCGGDGGERNGGEVAHPRQYTCSVVLPPPPGGFQGLITLSHHGGGGGGEAQAVVFESGVCGSRQEAQQRAAVAAIAFLMEEVWWWWCGGGVGVGWHNTYTHHG